MSDENGTTPMADGPEEMTPSGYQVDRPQDWDTAVACAYLRIWGHTQIQCAKGVGISRRTMQRWEASDWWGEACKEATGRWMVNLVQEARSTLIRAIRDGDADKALEILERMDPEFVPPPQELRVGIVGMVAQLPRSEVERLMALPEEERREELLRLTGGGDGDDGDD